MLVFYRKILTTFQPMRRRDCSRRYDIITSGRLQYYCFCRFSRDDVDALVLAYEHFTDASDDQAEVDAAETRCQPNRHVNFSGGGELGERDQRTTVLRDYANGVVQHRLNEDEHENGDYEHVDDVLCEEYSSIVHLNRKNTERIFWYN